MAEVLDGPFSRLMGATEHNWCRALDSGTGVTVLALLFSNCYDPGKLEQALEAVMRRHPRLRSQVIWVGDDKPAFQVEEDSSPPVVHVEEVEDGGTEVGDILAVHVEAEMNMNQWKDEHQKPLPVLSAKLLKLPSNNKSLFMVRVHTAACDRLSGAIVMAELLHHLKDGGLDESQCDTSEQLVALEDAIPKGQASKPFWWHGVDLLGYSLGSLRHALLPFENPEARPERTELIRRKLNLEQTQALLQRCEKEKTSIFGALTAAGLKATTVYKQLGSRAEHFATIGLADCRKMIDLLSPTTVGFYHAAVLNTHHVSETTELWELARRCSDSLSTAIKNRKHFTDMGDINYLMYQALQRPNLTPSSSLRTSLMVVFQDTLSDELADLKQIVGLEDYTGCSSVHGVGPSIAVFDSLRNGALHCNFVYAAPLYTRQQMQLVVDKMMEMLVTTE